MGRGKRRVPFKRDRGDGAIVVDKFGDDVVCIEDAQTNGRVLGDDERGECLVGRSGYVECLEAESALEAPVTSGEYGSAWISSRGVRARLRYAGGQSSCEDGAEGDEGGKLDHVAPIGFRGWK